MPEHNPGQLGGTMRLGLRKTIFKPGTSLISECKQIDYLLVYSTFTNVNDFCQHSQLIVTCQVIVCHRFLGA